MKKNELIKIIELVVRKEVKKQMTEIFINEEKEISLSETISKPKPKKVIKKKPKKQYSKNPVLNEVLNETVNDEEWKTMGGNTFNSSRMNEVVGKSYENMMSDNSNGSLAVEMGVDPNDPAAAFLKKDYRKLMKKVDEKKGK